MACASFLKFHPTLPKQGALVVTRPDLPLDKRRQELTKEERARQRHSVEVSNAGNYLHIQPSTLESLTRSAANASANRNRTKKLVPNNSNNCNNSGVIKEEQLNKASADAGNSNNYGYHTISVLPPALKSLVFLWEELTTNCLQAISQHMIIPSNGSPVNQNGAKNNKKAVVDNNKSSINSKNDCKEKNATIEKESKKSHKKKILPRNYLEDIGLSSYLHAVNSETLCELCGDVFPHPVTYHMHQMHPGCGQHAGGKGYNSGGNYCLGWAGNCGDGGIRKY